MNICLQCEGVTAAATERCGHCGVPLLALDSIHYPERRGEADAGNPLLGSVIDGKFRLEGVLGRGGLGTVFQAEHIGSLMKVALKLLHPRFSERPEYRRALLPEARRAATVTNERCARLLDVGETGDGGTWLAMELVEGVTLDAVMREGALRPSHAVDLLVQVAEALVAIHAAGLVHCDLSPRNVMVAMRLGKMSAKVLDFGIARTMSMSGPRDLAAGEFIGFGNPAFSAPEHLAGREIDARADLYSLGALAWLMLTGHAPIDDREPSQAARATIAGELEAWPGVAGVPRRLQRLIERCLQRDPLARPVTAAAVLRELRVVRGARRPGLQRAAVSMLAVAAFATAPAFFRAAPPYLDPRAGSALSLFDRLTDEQQPEIFPSSRLARVQFHFGGFDAANLRLDVSQHGTVITSAKLHPAVDTTSGTLTLALTQPEWRAAVESLIGSSREGPVDLSFVVPGHAPLGSTRIRLDDEGPVLRATPHDATVTGDALTAAFEFSCTVADAVALADAVIVVRLEGHGEVRLPLPTAAAQDVALVPLGQQLAAQLPGAAARGAVDVVVAATDQAGNRVTVDVAQFARCDLHAPEVVTVTGPAGEPHLPSLGGRVRLRVQLSEVEAGSRLQIIDRDGRELLQRQCDAASRFTELELEAGTGEVGFGSGSYVFAVTDAVGNQTRKEVPCTVRDRSVDLRLQPVGAALAIEGELLVLGRAGGQAALRYSTSFHPLRATLVGPGIIDESDGEVELDVLAVGSARLRFGRLPIGGHELVLEFDDVSGPPAGPAAAVRETRPVRVLPDVLQVRIRRASSRFLSGLLEQGVLAPAATGFREGAGWELAADLRPFLRGTVFVVFGGEAVVRRELQPATGPASVLLPPIEPLPGHTVVAVQLRDVLDRPVAVLVGDEPAPRVEVHGEDAAVVADFWWHDQAPEPIGEELLVEYGRPARLRLRLPLAYADDERELLVLSIGPGEEPATAVAAAGQGSIATFDIPFATWQAAARLDDLPRSRYAEQLQKPVTAELQTPVGPAVVTLSLRTTRSTLRPVQLGSLAELPPALAGLRLVPVLAPEGSFADPVPAGSPPRAVFRPQVSVAVDRLTDFLLQERELCCGEAAAIVELGLRRAATLDPATLVHADDPLGPQRLVAAALLPEHARAVPAATPLTGIDFYQAYTCCRLLGVVVGGDPGLFRLPMGTELELAALGEHAGKACNAAAARGRPVLMSAFRAAALRLQRGQLGAAAIDLQAHDAAPTSFGIPITGLDFGVREWVGDLPHIVGHELLLLEWNSHHDTHVDRITAFASGRVTPPQDLASALRNFAVVRGLALGELAGLIDESGGPLPTLGLTAVPASVPGVLRTEQLRRDGRDLLSAGVDPRLRLIGFRVVGTAALVQLLRGLD